MKRSSVFFLSIIVAGVVVFIELVAFIGFKQMPAPSPQLESAVREVPFPQSLPL
jgi:hypothetical protein